LTLDISGVPLHKPTLIPTSIKRFVPDPVVKFDIVIGELFPEVLAVLSIAIAASDTEANTIVAAIKSATIHPMLQL
jgi:hypothetical protein